MCLLITSANEGHISQENQKRYRLHELSLRLQLWLLQQRTSLWVAGSLQRLRDGCYEWRDAVMAGGGRRGGGGRAVCGR